MLGYWYIHENGERIFKPARVVDSMGATDYFDSPFVKHYWIGDDKDNRTPEEIAADKDKSP